MRLAIVISHPIQYYSPWFRFLAEHGRAQVCSPVVPLSRGPSLDLRVFYLWDGGVHPKLDPGFGVTVSWDIPLLDGYEFEFVPNRARHPGTAGIRGLNNPELAERVERFKPDAILVFGYNYLSHYRFLFSRARKGIPLLFRGDSHRLGKWKFGDGRLETERTSHLPSSIFHLPSILRRLWIASVFRRFAAFLYVGQANRAYFQYHGVPDERLFFCPHAVDNERFISQTETATRQAAEWKADLGIPPARRIVLFAGKFESKKRPRDLVAAFRAAGLKDVSLVLVGNGEQEEALRKDAAGDPAIAFAPFQNQTAMPRTYLLGDLFVLPSCGSGETWGLAVNEAMCMARPVIVSDHVGCAQDLVQEHRNGLIFPAGDVPALAAALREAFSDADRLRAWGGHSREIIEGYSYEQATKGLLSALEFVSEKLKVESRK